jgi:hypothetical protein
MTKSTIGEERLSFGSIERDGIVLAVDSRGLTLRTIEYHCPPAHLRREELRRLGFVLLPVGRRRLPPSSALAWDRHARRGEPRGRLPEGIVLNGYVLARVRAGVDVFVTSCSAQELLVGPEELARVGLRVRTTPLKPVGTRLQADRQGEGGRA